MHAGMTISRNHAMPLLSIERRSNREELIEVRRIFSSDPCDISYLWPYIMQFSHHDVYVFYVCRWVSWVLCQSGPFRLRGLLQRGSAPVLRVATLRSTRIRYSHDDTTIGTLQKIQIQPKYHPSQK